MIATQTRMVSPAVADPVLHFFRKPSNAGPLNFARVKMSTVQTETVTQVINKNLAAFKRRNPAAKYVGRREPGTNRLLTRSHAPL